MSYVIFKEPGIKIDLRVKKQYLPQLVGYVRSAHCAYDKEAIQVIKELNEEWAVLKNVTAENGKDLGQLIGLFYSMDWIGLTAGAEDKFYFVIHKARGKKHGGKNRKKADSGREGGTGEGPAGDI